MEQQKGFGVTHINEAESYFSQIYRRSKLIAFEPATKIIYLIFLQTEKQPHFQVL